MGSFFGNIGNAIKKGVTDAGHAVGTVASNPFVDGAIGAFLGPGAAAGGLGHLIAPGGNIGSAAKGAAVGYGAGKVGQFVKGPLGAMAGKVFGTGTPGSVSSATGSGGGAWYDPDTGEAVAAGTPGAIQAPGDPSSVAGGGGSAPGGGAPGGDTSLLGRLKGLVGTGASAFGGGGGSSNSLLDSLLLGGAAASQAADKARVTGLQNNAVNAATSAYNEKAPLRARALASLSSDQPAPDLSSIFADPGNVYDRQRRGLPPLTAGPSAASQRTGGNALSGALAARVPAAAPVPS